MADAAALHEEYVEAVQRQDLAFIREILHPDYTYTGADGSLGGADAGLAVAETYGKAFPDLVLRIDRHHVASGDVSIVEIVATGTHLGDLQGIAPTGRTVTARVCNVIEVRDGKVIAERDYYDGLSMMQQLGVIPTD